MFTSISCQPELKVVEAKTVIVYLRVKPTVMIPQYLIYTSEGEPTYVSELVSKTQRR